MEDTKMTVWHHEDTDPLLHEQRSILMSNVSPVKQAMQAVLERLQAILQGCRLRMNPRKSHPHTYPQLLALDRPKAASLDAYGGGIRHSLEKIG